MAKIVIAGVADCPYYAKAEMLGDLLARNLPDFKLHKIVKNQQEWKGWLEKMCAQSGWCHTKSPLIWRELVDRGGKGTLIGGANEFQEYVKGYYDIKSILASNDMTSIARENLQTKLEIDEEEAEFRAQSRPVKVCISNASCAVAYSMVADIARGDALGRDTEVALCLFDSDDEKLDSLSGVEMEAVDLACPLLRSVTITSNMHQAFADCSIIVLLEELTKEECESSDDWMKRNHDHFVNYAHIINEVASPDVKVLISGSGPVNFNTQMFIENAPSLARQNIVAVPRIVENHAKAILAERLNVNSAGVVDIIIWGNVNSTLFVDVNKARVHGYDGAIWGPPSFSVSATEMVHDEKWLQGEFLKQLSCRTEYIEGALGHRAARSQGAALITLLNHWWCGSTTEQIFSLGVYSEGIYGVPRGLVFSLPITFSLKGYWSVVEDIDLSDDNKQKLQQIVQELQREREVIFPPPKPPTPPSTEVQTSQDENINSSAQSDEENVETESKAAGEVAEGGSEKPSSPVGTSGEQEEESAEQREQQHMEEPEEPEPED